jgi:hypothetical protein
VLFGQTVTLFALRLPQFLPQFFLPQPLLRQRQPERLLEQLFHHAKSDHQ